MKRLLNVTAPLLLATCLSGCGAAGSSTNSNAKSGDTDRVTATEIYNSYKTDGQGAASKYRGRTLTVTGTANSYTGDGAAKTLRIHVYGQGTEVFAITCTSSDPQWGHDVEGVRLSQAVTFSGTLQRIDASTLTAEFDNCRLVPKQ